MVFPESFLPKDNALRRAFRAELPAGTHLFERNIALLFRNTRQRKVSPNKSPFPKNCPLQLELRAHCDAHREFPLRPHLFRTLFKQPSFTAWNAVPLLSSSLSKEGIGLTE